MKSKNNSRTYGFLILSTMTHVALAAGILALNVRSETKKLGSSEGTAVEISDSAPSAAPAQEPEMQTQEVTPAAPIVAAEPKVVAAPKITSVAKLPSKAVKALPAKVSAPAVVEATAETESAPTTVNEETPVAEESPVLVPVTEKTDAESAEEKDTNSEAVAATDETKIDETESKASDAQDTIDQETEKAMKEQEALAAAASERIAQEAQADREAEKARLAEQSRLAEEARQAEIARQAEAAHQAEIARQSQVAGQGNAQSGSSTSTGEGSPVRALSELKQMPGNPKPQYDAQDRLQGRQGKVAFVAYVTSTGTISEFKLLKSSGHRELDAKTLKALKGWKFYPGQEGWVEMGFNWDLKGEPQEMPARLRLKSQASQN